MVTRQPVVTLLDLIGLYAPKTESTKCTLLCNFGTRTVISSECVEKYLIATLFCLSLFFHLFVSK